MTKAAQSPLHKQLEAADATFENRGNRIVARSFGRLEDEALAARQGVVVMDRNDRALLSVAGPDAARFLHGMITNHVQDLAPGSGNYSCHLDVKGHIQADFHLFAMPDHFLLETDATRATALRESLAKYIIADKVEITDQSGQLHALSVLGPASELLLAALGATPIPEHDYEHNWVELDGAPALVARVDEAGGPGYRVICTHQNAAAAWTALTAEREEFQCAPIGHDTLNVLRTEAGIPWTGAELTETTLPPEARLDRSAISYDKGCYIGQEIVERIRSRGNVNRLLCGLVLDGTESSDLPELGAALIVEGKSAGKITTVVHSPTLGKNIALCYLRREHSEPGTVITVEDAGTACVSTLPFGATPEDPS